MAGDDLEGALTSQVQAGEDGQDGLGEEEEADSDGEVRSGPVNTLIFLFKLAIWYYYSFTPPFTIPRQAPLAPRQSPEAKKS